MNERADEANRLLAIHVQAAQRADRAPRYAPATLHVILRALAAASIVSLPVIVACEAGTPPAPPRTATTPIASGPNGVTSAASAAPSATTSGTRAAPRSLDQAAAWTDGVVIDALAKDCHALDARAAAPDPGGIDANQDPLACGLAFDQSCSYDPCGDQHKECARACGGTCSKCTVSCATACDACKRPCADDACRRACAASTGACTQRCIQTRDGCATGGCAKEVPACLKREAAAWRANGCAAKCPPTMQRWEACRTGEEDCRSKCNDQACVERCGTLVDVCFATVKKGFAPCDVGYCLFGPGPYEPGANP
jgi:hypothetical protein